MINIFKLLLSLFKVVSVSIQVLLSPDELKTMKGVKGKTLGDSAANATTHLRENITLKRGLLLKVKDDLRICGCTHPLFSRFGSGTQGYCGSLLVYKTNAENKFLSTVVKQLCLHVIGENFHVISHADLFFDFKSIVLLVVLYFDLDNG